MKYRIISVLQTKGESRIAETIMVADNIADKFFNDLNELNKPFDYGLIMSEPLICRSPKDISKSLISSLSQERKERLK